MSKRQKSLEEYLGTEEGRSLRRFGEQEGLSRERVSSLARASRRGFFTATTVRGWRAIWDQIRYCLSPIKGEHDGP